jgi:hypothetical protein
LRSPLRPFLDVPPLLRVWNVGYLLLTLLIGSFFPLIALLGVITGRATTDTTNALTFGLGAAQVVGVIEAAVFVAWMIAVQGYAWLLSSRGTPIRVYGILWRGLSLGVLLAGINLVVVTGACSFTECAFD